MTEPQLSQLIKARERMEEIKAKIAEARRVAGPLPSRAERMARFKIIQQQVTRPDELPSQAAPSE